MVVSAVVKGIRRGRSPLCDKTLTKQGYHVPNDKGDGSHEADPIEGGNVVVWDEEAGNHKATQHQKLDGPPTVKVRINEFQDVRRQGVLVSNTDAAGRSSHLQKNGAQTWSGWIPEYRCVTESQR